MKMGIRSEEAIALGRIADKLQSLDNTMQKIEKDLHSIDISLGAMRPKTINDIRQRYGFKPLTKEYFSGKPNGNKEEQ